MGATSLHREPGLTDRAFYADEALRGAGEILDYATIGGVFYAAVRNLKDGSVWALISLQRRRGSSSRGCNFTYKAMHETAGPGEARCPTRILALLSPLPDCTHLEDYCRLCSRPVTFDGQNWLSEAEPGQVAGLTGPRCYSGYPYGSEAPGGGRPFHEPGGVAPCSTCYAREWRQRCLSFASRAAAARRAIPGTKLKFARPIRFADNVREDTFELVGRSTFRRMSDGVRVRIPSWRTTSGWEMLAA